MLGQGLKQLKDGLLIVILDSSLEALEDGVILSEAIGQSGPRALVQAVQKTALMK